jgi:lipoprotein-anchoring transpeptidase ErfK/SrfK
VPVYASKVFNGVEWLMIGDQEWVEGRFVASVQPSTAPPLGVDNGRWIDINLAEQTLSAYDNNQLVYSTLISSGVDPYWTRPGLFQIYKKKDTENMSGSFEADRSDFYSLQDVPWTMYFDKARAIHGAYWHTFFGYPMSHGCVNMSIGDSAWLYQWAKEGDWVWVHDPSGRTPENPDLYGSGAP